MTLIRLFLCHWLRSLLTAVLILMPGALLSAQNETPSPTPTLSVTPSLAADDRPLECPDAPPTRLIVKERARVVTEGDRVLNLREEPNIDSPVIIRVPRGSILYVLAGPECADQFAWFEVDYRDVTGWIAEGAVPTYFVEIYPPGG